MDELTKQQFRADKKAGKVSSFAEWLSNTTSQAATAANQYLQDAYKNNVPSQYRMYLRSLTGDTSPITESYLSGSDMDSIRALVQQIETNRANDWRHANDKMHVNYLDNGDGTASAQNIYGPPPPTPQSVGRTTYNSGTFNRLPQDQVVNAMRSLGSFKYNFDPSGNLIINDKYDFNPSDNGGKDPSLISAAMRSVRYGELEPLAFALGRKMAPAESGGYPINLNLGNPNNWKW